MMPMSPLPRAVGGIPTSVGLAGAVDSAEWPHGLWYAGAALAPTSKPLAAMTTPAATADRAIRCTTCSSLLVEVGWPESACRPGVVPTTTRPLEPARAEHVPP